MRRKHSVSLLRKAASSCILKVQQESTESLKCENARLSLTTLRQHMTSYCFLQHVDHVITYRFLNRGAKRGGQALWFTITNVNELPASR